MMLINHISKNNDTDGWQILLYDPEAMHYQYDEMVLEMSDNTLPYCPQLYVIDRLLHHSIFSIGLLYDLM